MPFTPKDLLYGVLVPVVVAAFLSWTLRRFLPKDLGSRYPAPLASLGGFLLGYGLLSLAPWRPTAHWHWLPHLTVLATIVGSISCAEGMRRFEQTVLVAITASLVAWLLVPTWDDLDPSRSVYLGVFVSYVTVLTISHEMLAQRLPGKVLPGILFFTAMAAAVVLAISGSLRFSQIAIAGAAAFLGIAIGSFRSEENHVAGLGMPFAVLTVGSLAVGQLNSFSEVPRVSYLLLPAAPLLLWLGAFGPLSRMAGMKRTLGLSVLPILLLALAVAVAGFAEFGAASEY